MPRDPDKAYLDRDEWKVLEAQYAEIPVSQLNLSRSRDGETMSSKEWLESIPDDRLSNSPDGQYQSGDDFFDVFARLENSDGTSDRLKETIRKIGSKPGCLSPLRWKALELWLMGKSKRDITKCLYPSRMHELDGSSQGTVGVEVYVQRMLNHFIPMKLRYYVEQHYPHVVFKYLGYYPLHPKFVKKAWMNALRESEDPIKHMLDLYSGNPACLMLLKKVLQDEGRAETVKVNRKWYLGPVQSHRVADYLLRKWSKRKFDYRSVRATMFNKEHGFRLRSALLYLLMYVDKGR